MTFEDLFDTYIADNIIASGTDRALLQGVWNSAIVQAMITCKDAGNAGDSLASYCEHVNFKLDKLLNYD